MYAGYKYVCCIPRRMGILYSIYVSRVQVGLWHTLKGGYTAVIDVTDNKHTTNMLYTLPVHLFLKMVLYFKVNVVTFPIKFCYSEYCISRIYR